MTNVIPTWYQKNGKMQDQGSQTKTLFGEMWWESVYSREYFMYSVHGMNPTLTSYEEKISQAEQLAKNEAIATNKELKQELFTLTEELEQEEKILTKNILEHNGKEKLQQLQQRKLEALKGIDFSDIKEELSDLKNTTTETVGNGIVSTTTITEVVSNEDSQKEKKDKNLWDKAKEQRNNFGEKHPVAQKIVLWATIIGGWYMLGKWFGWWGKEKQQENNTENNKLSWSKVPSWLKRTLGIWWAAVAYNYKDKILDFLWFNGDDKKKDTWCEELLKEETAITYDKKKNIFLYKGKEFDRNDFLFEDKNDDKEKLTERMKEVDESQPDIVDETTIKEKLKNNLEAQKNYNTLAASINQHQKDLQVDHIQLWWTEREKIDTADFPWLYVAQLDESYKEVGRMCTNNTVWYLFSLSEDNWLESLLKDAADLWYDATKVLRDSIPQGDNILTKGLSKASKDSLKLFMKGLDPKERDKAIKKIIDQRNKYVAIMQYTRDVRKSYEARLMQAYLEKNESWFVQKTPEEQNTISIQKLKDQTYYQSAGIPDAIVDFDKQSLLSLQQSPDPNIQQALQKPFINNELLDIIQDIEDDHTKKSKEIATLKLSDKEKVHNIADDLIDDMESDGYYKWYSPFQARWDLCFDTDDKMLANHMRTMRNDQVSPLKEKLTVITDKIDKGLQLNQSDLTTLAEVEQEYTNFKKEAMQSIEQKQLEGDNGTWVAGTAWFSLKFTLKWITNKLFSEVWEGNLLAIGIASRWWLKLTSNIKKYYIGSISRWLLKIHPVPYAFNIMRNHYGHLLTQERHYQRLLKPLSWVEKSVAAKNIMLYEFAKWRMSLEEMRHLFKGLDVNIVDNIDRVNPKQKDYEKLFKFLLKENPEKTSKETIQKLAEIASKDRSKLKEAFLYQREWKRQNFKRVRDFLQGKKFKLSTWDVSIKISQEITDNILHSLWSLPTTTAPTLESLTTSQKTLATTLQKEADTIRHATRGYATDAIKEAHATQVDNLVKKIPDFDKNQIKAITELLKTDIKPKYVIGLIDAWVNIPWFMRSVEWGMPLVGYNNTAENVIKIALGDDVEKKLIQQFGEAESKAIIKNLSETFHITEKAGQLTRLSSHLDEFVKILKIVK